MGPGQGAGLRGDRSARVSPTSARVGESSYYPVGSWAIRRGGRGLGPRILSLLGEVMPGVSKGQSAAVCTFMFKVESPLFLKCSERRPFCPQGPWSVPMRTPVSVCPLCEAVTLLLSPGRGVSWTPSSWAPRPLGILNDRSTGVAHTGLCLSVRSQGGQTGQSPHALGRRPASTSVCPAVSVTPRLGAPGLGAGLDQVPGSVVGHRHVLLARRD